MIWQENSRIIVMTTREVEKGRVRRGREGPFFPQKVTPFYLAHLPVLALWFRLQSASSVGMCRTFLRNLAGPTGVPSWTFSPPLPPRGSAVSPPSERDSRENWFVYSFGVGWGKHYRNTSKHRPRPAARNKSTPPIPRKSRELSRDYHSLVGSSWKKGNNGCPAVSGAGMHPWTCSPFQRIQVGRWCFIVSPDVPL